MAAVRRRNVFNLLSLCAGVCLLYVLMLLVQWITSLTPVQGVANDLPVLIKSIVPREKGMLDITLTVNLQDVIRHLEGYQHPNGEATANPVPMNTTLRKNLGGEFCSPAAPPKYLVYIHTSPANEKRRALVRETWGNSTFYDKKGGFKVVFMMGLPSNRAEQEIVDKEYEKYNDIVQGNFVDNYRNLTLKGIMALKWVSEFCSSAKYVIKADDDAFINTFKLVKLIEKNDKKEKLVVCPLWKDHSMPILRNPDKCMKWCVKYSEFPGMQHFPKYCAGLTYAMSGDIVPLMYKKSLRTPFFWIDDVYITGLLVGKIPDVNYVNIMQNFTLKEKVAVEEYKKHNVTPHYLISHVKDPTIWHTMWNSALAKRQI